MYGVCMYAHIFCILCPHSFPVYSFIYSMKYDKHQNISQQLLSSYFRGSHDSMITTV